MSDPGSPSASAVGSLGHIWRYVNKRPDLLSDVVMTALPSLSSVAKGELEWVSPLGAELECWNRRFLEKLDLLDWEEDFRSFWPFSGSGTPHWDALAKVPTKDGPGVVLVEAKAHLGEFDKPKDSTGAKDAVAVGQITRACESARASYGVPTAIPAWEKRYYQVGNRLTHLWWMRTIPKLPTWLVWVFFTNDHDPWPHDALNAYEWQSAYERVMGDVGLPTRHPFASFIAPCYLPPG